MKFNANGKRRWQRACKLNEAHTFEAKGSCRSVQAYSNGRMTGEDVVMAIYSLLQDKAELIICSMLGILCAQY